MVEHQSKGVRDERRSKYSRAVRRSWYSGKDRSSYIEKESAADRFASNKLISETDYQIFVAGKNYEIESIKSFAASQNVMPYIVIGRLQKEKKLDYRQFSNYKLRYKWAE